jgi:sulfate transport system substrate-binding protein
LLPVRNLAVTDTVTRIEANYATSFLRLIDMNLKLIVLALISTLAVAANAIGAELLNVSYDVSRELFEAINPSFAAEWKQRSGETVMIRQSHSGSSRQARAVLDGLQADVVTLNQVTDISILQKAGLVADDWQKRLPNESSPYYSLPMFLVRGGNPKKIKDWNDLVRSDVKVVFPNPETSGNGKYTYLAAYAYALSVNQNVAEKAKQFVTRLLGNVPVSDTGGRGATTTFIEREIGDVLVTFESEVSAIRNEYGKVTLEAVVPSISLRADFPVAVVDKVANKRGTQKLATAYLEFLFSPAGQEILAKHHNRVHDKTIAAKYAKAFPSLKLVTAQEVFGGWEAVTRDHFSKGGILEQVTRKAAELRRN